MNDANHKPVEDRLIEGELRRSWVVTGILIVVILLVLLFTIWLSGQTLASSHLREEGINVLGVKKTDGTYIGDLSGDTLLEKGDCLVIYGRIDAIKSLDRRKKGKEGDLEHQEAIEERKSQIWGKSQSDF